jgi:hypothetical protein
MDWRKQTKTELNRLLLQVEKIELLDAEGCQVLSDEIHSLAADLEETAYDIENLEGDFAVEEEDDVEEEEDE